ncbi:MAG TPA: PQQ-binding-like beta-propeller repeat protein [Polyangiaceae bacterium]|nr:PQQ-binding-like beta-propeller repeat protein [Polyangiaceae bacterium]
MRSTCSHHTTPLVLAALAAGWLPACSSSPGESELRVLSPEDASESWRAQISSEWFTPDPAAPDGVLRVHASDYCGSANISIDFDRDTGEPLGETRPAPRTPTQADLELLDPPSPCEQQLATQRVALSSGERLDVCGRDARDAPLVVMNVAARTERFRLPASGVVNPWMFADHLLLTPVGEEGRIDVFSLDTGEPLWSWTPPEEFTYVQGVDAERVYAWAENSHETYALALADGSPVWQENLGCEWLSLASERLVCGRSLSESSCDASD